MKIELEPYSADWSEIYDDISNHLTASLNHEIEIHHIGSTAIPGIASKPIIDILIGIHKSHSLDDYVDPIVNMGYQYIKTYNDIMPFRRYFIMLGNELNHTQHIHLVHKTHPFFADHLFFRDYLILNPEKAKEYEALKIELSKNDWKDGNEYANAKSDFITGIMKNKPKK